MAVSVFQAARSEWPARGAERDAADKFIRDVSGPRAGSSGAGERDSQEVSEVLRFPWVHAIQQLLHDHDFSDAVALAGLRLDVGEINRDCDICAAGVVGAAFWVDAVEESLNR